MKILIFGGTTEGRLLAQALSQRGLPATVSVATPLGHRSCPVCPASPLWWAGRQHRKWQNF